MKEIFKRIICLLSFQDKCLKYLYIQFNISLLYGTYCHDCSHSFSNLNNSPILKLHFKENSLLNCTRHTSLNSIDFVIRPFTGRIMAYRCPSRLIHLFVVDMSDDNSKMLSPIFMKLWKIVNNIDVSSLLFSF